MNASDSNGLLNILRRVHLLAADELKDTPTLTLTLSTAQTCPLKDELTGAGLGENKGG